MSRATSGRRTLFREKSRGSQRRRSAAGSAPLMREAASGAGKRTDRAAEYAERLTVGERLDPEAILREQPESGKALLEYLEDFLDLEWSDNVKNEAIRARLRAWCPPPCR